MENRCFLVLDDKSIFSGLSFGKLPPRPGELNIKVLKTQPAGEIVFNTGMAGYTAIFTDPSYTGQILVMTYPHIGNYGVDDKWSESGPEDKKTRNVIKTAGIVVRALYRGPVPEKRLTLDQFLKKHSVSGITEVDTRRLTLQIRDHGNPKGVIITPENKNASELSESEMEKCLAFLKQCPDMEGSNLITGVGTDKFVTLNKTGSPYICLVDCGIKANIIRQTIALGCKVTLVPSYTAVEDILSLHTDGILFSNGPGDPAVLADLIKLAKAIIGKKPVFGICLGHQILALALGAKTYKMKFGHHGVNHPVRDERSGRVLITSQNHGFAVQENTLPPDLEVLFRNVNDRTIEGIIHKKLPIITAQFHPEAAPGPYDSLWIFKEFLKFIG